MPPSSSVSPVPCAPARPRRAEGFMHISAELTELELNSGSVKNVILLVWQRQLGCEIWHQKLILPSQLFELGI